MRGSDPTAEYLLLLALGCGVSQLLGAIFVRPTLAPPSSAGYRSLETVDVDDRVRSASPPHGLHPARSTSPRPRLPHTPPPSSPLLEAGNPFLAEPVSRSRTASKERDPHTTAGDVNISGWALLGQRDFHLMFLELGLCSGVGLMYINNIVRPCQL